MKNRILSLTRNSIPFVKDLMPLAHTVAGCILMQQLDYWFQKKPNGYYKFLEPPQQAHNSYRMGDSWSEELGLSGSEFRTAFDRIGIRYKSKGQFNSAENKFQGKFYCSYLDRRDNLTFYFRNHELLDTALDSLIFNQNGADTANVKRQFPVSIGTSFTADVDSQVAQIDMPDLQGRINRKSLLTETTSEIRQIPQQPGNANNDEGSHLESELIFPSSISDEERVALIQMFESLPPQIQQNMLDELHGAMKAGVIRRGNIPFVRSLINAFCKHQFVPCLGVPVLAARNAKIKHKIDEGQKAPKQTSKGKAEGLLKIRAACLK